MHIPRHEMCLRLFRPRLLHVRAGLSQPAFALCRDAIHQCERRGADFLLERFIAIQCFVARGVRLVVADEAVERGF